MVLSQASRNKYRKETESVEKPLRYNKRKRKEKKKVVLLSDV